MAKNSTFICPNVCQIRGGKQAKMADRSLSQEKQGPKKTVFSILMVIYDVNK